MPDNFNWNQFGAGWIPSDDAVNGRKNGCLKMDNLELDQNGALTLAGGTTVEGSAYSYNAHTLFSNIISGSRKDYLADTNGGIFRNGSSIGTGGDSSNAGFGVAFDFTLVCSGSTRLKDSGSSTVPLGLTTPPGVGTAVLDGYINSIPFTGSSYQSHTVLGTLSGSTLLGSGHFGWTTILADATALAFTIQTFSSGGSPVGDATVFTAVNTTSTSISYEASDQDYFNFEVIQTNWSQIQSITIDILLAPGDSSGDPVSNYFTQTYTVLGSESPQDQFIAFQRGNFQRVGTSNLGWQNVYDIRVTIVGSGAFTIGAMYLYWAMIAGALPGGSSPISSEALLQLNTLGGIPNPGSQGYQFAQLNVNQTASYTAKSQLSPASGTLYPFNNTICILPDISGIESQVNQIWIFVRGGTMDQWYLALTFLAANWTVPQYYAASDVQTIEVDITVNLNLVSINSTGITEKIYDIVGPIEGRWFYFTNDFMWPSDINDPDLVDTSLGIRTTGATAEIFLWARRAAANQVWVGTSRDIYILAGTFETLPDGSIDVFYQSLSAKFPPISYDATSSGQAVFYLAADGWRSMDGVGNCTALTPTNTDRLYRGITCYGYSVDVQVLAGSTRFPCVLARNKLWCSITGQSRMEVLDPTRSYWRNFAIGKGDCLAICSTQDGNILGFFASDKKLRVLDVQSSLEIDGSTAQTVTLLSPVFDNGTPRQRKDLYTLKVRANTDGANLACYLIDDTGTSNSLGNVNTSSLVETNLDVSQVIGKSKWFQFSATGSFSGLTIDDFELFFDTRPIPLTFLRLYNNNFGGASKKRLRVWPQIIDTGGRTVVFQPINDNTNGTPQNLSSTDKTTELVFYKTDVFAVDYGATLYCSSGTFEYWGALDPDIVQVLPIARQFDQVGPEELFRYGRIKQIELRVLAFGTTIPYTMYFNDNSVSNGDLTVPNGQETTVAVGLPMGNSGAIVRVVFGPTSFNFHRFYLRAQVMKSGRDTDLEWVTIPDPQEGE